jgi:hypothetical protein
MTSIQSADTTVNERPTRPPTPSIVRLRTLARRLGPAGLCTTTLACFALLASGTASARTSAVSTVTLISPTSRAQPAGTLRLRIRSVGTVRGLTLRFDRRPVFSWVAGSGVRELSLSAQQFRPGVHYLTEIWRDARNRRHVHVLQLISLRRDPKLLLLGTTHPAVGFVALHVWSEQGVHSVRVSVNGRVTVVSTRGRGRPITVNLAAANGIRFGSNRIKVAAASPSARTYDLQYAVVTVSRSLPLLGRTASYQGSTGAAARLNGRVLLPKGAAGAVRQLRYRWTIVSKPDGSTPVLRGASSPEPTIQANTLGSYQLALKVSSPRLPGGTSAGSLSYAVEYDVSPPIPVSGAWLETNPSDPKFGFRVGETSYAIDEEGSNYGEYCPAVLVLDASNLTPLNTFVSRSGKLSVQELTHCNTNEYLNEGIAGQIEKAAPHGNHPLLAVLVSKRGPYLVNEIDAEHPSSYVFTPNLSAPDVGIKSGWYHESSDETGGGLRGWLQREYNVTASSSANTPGTLPVVSGLGPFQFSPGAMITYQTHGPGASGTNTMTFGSESPEASRAISTPVTAMIPGGAADGFQLVVLDNNGRVEVDKAYAATEAAALAAELNNWANQTPSGESATVLLQSIGRPVPSGTSWNSLASAVGRLNGASSPGGHGGPDALLRLGATPPPAPISSDPNPGTYALVATVGPDAQPNPLGNAPTTVEASALEGSAGELAGVLQMTQHGALAPALSGPAVNASLASLKALSQGAPSSAGPDEPAEDAVLKFISGYAEYGFNQTAANTCYPGAQSLPAVLLVRASYCSVTLTRWQEWSGKLYDWANGSTPVPAAYLAENPKDTGGASFKRIAQTLAAEFGAVADVRAAFGAGGLVPATINQVSTLLNADGLHDIARYTPQAAASQQATFNLWRFVVPALKVLSNLPGAEPLEPVASLMELGQVFLEGDGANEPQPEGINQQVSTGQLKLQAIAELSDAQLALGPVLDRILTDPQKLLRASENLAGINQAPPFKNPSANDLYVANWNQSDVTQGTDVVAMVQGLNQNLATAWTSAYYSVWQLPTADAHSSNKAPQMRNPSETWKLNCNYYTKATGERREWHVFAKNPIDANDSGDWPDDASYVPLDQSTPSAIWTLVQNQNGSNPWQSYYTTKGTVNSDRHVAPPDPGLLELLTKPPTVGGYGIPTSQLFTKGIETVNPLSAKDAGNFYTSNDCGY